MKDTVDKIRPQDDRVQSRFIDVEGHKWRESISHHGIAVSRTSNADTVSDYLEALPKGESKGTIVLVHGFPDMSLAWRYQIPFLVGLGYRTLAIDCMGYGKTVCLAKHSYGPVNVALKLII